MIEFHEGSRGPGYVDGPGQPVKGEDDKRFCPICANEVEIEVQGDVYFFESSKCDRCGWAWSQVV